jgi:hypothetical protein
VIVCASQKTQSTDASGNQVHYRVRFIASQHLSQAREDTTSVQQIVGKAMSEQLEPSEAVAKRCRDLGVVQWCDSTLVVASAAS